MRGKWVGWRGKGNEAGGERRGEERRSIRVTKGGERVEGKKGRTGGRVEGS